MPARGKVRQKPSIRACLLAKQTAITGLTNHTELQGNWLLNVRDSIVGHSSKPVYFITLSDISIAWMSKPLISPSLTKTRKNQIELFRTSDYQGFWETGPRLGIAVYHTSRHFSQEASLTSWQGEISFSPSLHLVQSRHINILPSQNWSGGHLDPRANSPANCKRFDIIMNFTSLLPWVKLTMLYEYVKQETYTCHLPTQ